MIISITVAKIISFFLRLLHRGATTLPGKIALKIKYNVLTKLSRGVRIICITGTNGKTTTAALVAHVLKKDGRSYFINSSGANMISGVTTSFIENSTVFGRCKKDFAILECDENSLPEISRYLDAEVVAVTNIFRDQLDRYGEITHTLDAIKRAIKNMPEAKLILNADEPISFSLSKLSRKTVTFGLDVSKSCEAVSDIRYCPLCGEELVYSSRIFAQLGNYRCKKCLYRRPAPDFEISAVNGNSFILNGEICKTALNGLYNLYNFAAAAAILNTINAGNIKDLCTFSGAFGRMEYFDCGGRTVLLLLVKNPVGFTGCIKYICSLNGDIDIGFALNDNEADGTDVSWIWDCDFTPLKTKGSRVYTVGLRAYDMALRLKYDGIETDKILDGEEYKTLIKIIKEADRDFVIFSSYTAMMNMRRQFISAFGGKEFWE